MATQENSSAFEVMNSAMEDLYNIQALNDAIHAAALEAELDNNHERKSECANNANRLSLMVRERLEAVIAKLDAGSFIKA